MGAGMMDIVMLVILLGGAYFLITSGVLNSLGQAAATPVIPGATVPTTDTTGTTPAAGDTTTPTTTTPAATGNPLLDALNNLLSGGTGGTNTVPTTDTTPADPGPINPQPIYQGNPTECKSRYNGSCSTECSSGNQSLCNACNIACGGATVGVSQIGGINTIDPGSGGTGGVRTPECSSKYNGKCDTECKSGNTSTCSACKRACGLYAHALYVHVPTNQIGSTVFKNANYSAWSNWGNVVVANSR